MRLSSVAILLLACSVPGVEGQVYSPRVLKKGQPDSADLAALARSVFTGAAARTPREKAEAIWRFFLTDGRFVKPGMIYHIAGWAYEEPRGEVLDTVKLLNSYGFGLCYHIAPLLESVFKAGGFADARVWFLTGHTVAEVFYDGGYHYFDSDMMGYNPIGTAGPLKERPVASVHQIELDGGIITGKLAVPKQDDVSNVDFPWYPADVRAHAISDLAQLFTTTKDNLLFPSQRFQSGHTMDFELRPGERLVRYFHPEPEGLFYLPYRFDGTSWREFPEEVAQYNIRTADGPRSQKDERTWATGVRQYRPPAMTTSTAVYSMPSPYVIIDANFQMTASLPGAGDQIRVETSTDEGQTWTDTATLTGPYQGLWSATPAVLTKSEHGSRNAVSGTYGYLVRVTRRGAQISDLTLTTRFQLNPRTLPELAAGENALDYSSSDVNRWELQAAVPARISGAAPVVSGGQTYIANTGGAAGEIIFAVEAPDGGDLGGFDAGARFLDLREGLAPDKFTAEVRKVAPWPAAGEPQTASLSWSASIEGPYQTLWSYDPQLEWKDGEPIDRTLRWPEVDRQVRDLAPGTHRLYVRYQMRGIAIDTLRLAAVRTGLHSRSPLQITHVWRENGERHERVERIAANQMQNRYEILIPSDAKVSNEALVLENPVMTEQVAVIESRFAPYDVRLKASPDTEFWRAAPATFVDTDDMGKQQSGHKTQVRSRWTQSNLYFQFTCHYRELYLHPNPSRATETNGLWDWDVAEVFIGSDFQNIRHYREFEMSPQGEWLDLDIDRPQPGAAEAWKWDSGFEVTSAIDEKNRVWYGAMRIPYASLDERAAAADNLLRFNFYREQGPPPRRVEIAWRPTMQRSFHVPERFGTLKLVP